jgi:prepilin-type N-terminal cleavage/methylation domain-containing protein
MRTWRLAIFLTENPKINRRYTMRERNFLFFSRAHKSRRKGGFTLIELLIVVAIIALLAAIAIPNYLEAQLRAKIARSKANQRTASLVLEMYAVDNGDYPPWFMAWGGWIYWGGLPVFLLTTPIAYVTDGMVFWDVLGTSWVYSWKRLSGTGISCLHWPPMSGCDPDTDFAPEGLAWKADPDRACPPNPRYVIIGAGPTGLVLPELAMYDATNGTVSEGRIYRYGP